MYAKKNKIEILPGKSLLVLMVAVVLGIGVRFAYIPVSPAGYIPDAGAGVYACDVFLLLFFVFCIKASVRIFKNHPVISADVIGIRLVHPAYGETFIIWEDIKEIVAKGYSSPRGYKFRSIKIIPKNYQGFVSSFGRLRRFWIRMANAGAGKMIDIPQMMLNTPVADVAKQLEGLRADLANKKDQ
jgi:hypothetical protein